MTNSFGYLPKSHKILWIALRVIILAWGIYGLFHGSVVEFLEAIFAIIFTHLWDFFQIFGKKSFIIEVDYLAQTMLNIFIFVAVCIGTTLNNRTTFEHFDLVTHFGSGFLSAWFGYDFANIVYRKRGDLGPAMSSLFSLSFALSIAVGWEVYEFTMDSLYGMTLHKGNTDTMVDFISYKQVIAGVSGATTWESMESHIDANRDIFGIDTSLATATGNSDWIYEKMYGLQEVFLNIHLILQKTYQNI